MDATSAITWDAKKVYLHAFTCIIRDPRNAAFVTWFATLPDVPSGGVVICSIPASTDAKKVVWSRKLHKSPLLWWDTHNYTDQLKPIVPWLNQIFEGFLMCLNIRVLVVIFRFCMQDGSVYQHHTDQNRTFWTMVWVRAWYRNLDVLWCGI